MAEHRHPLNRHNIAFGERLRTGDTIQPDDLYDSTTGMWEKAPCPGVVLQEGCSTYWIRPNSPPLQTRPRMVLVEYDRLV